MKSEEEYKYEEIFTAVPILQRVINIMNKKCINIISKEDITSSERYNMLTEIKEKRETLSKAIITLAEIYSTKNIDEYEICRKK